MTSKRKNTPVSPTVSARLEDLPVKPVDAKEAGGVRGGAGYVVPELVSTLPPDPCIPPGPCLPGAPTIQNRPRIS